MSVKLLCQNGGTLTISVRVSDSDFGGLKLIANVDATVHFHDQRLCMIRGSIKEFTASGNIVLDMANTHNQRYPNSIIEGAEDILNLAFCYKAYQGIKAKNVEFFSITVKHDGENWVKTTAPAVGMEELAEKASSLLDSALDDVVPQAPKAKEEKKEKAGKAFKKNEK